MGPQSSQEGDGLRAGSGDWAFLDVMTPLPLPILKVSRLARGPGQGGSQIPWQGRGQAPGGLPPFGLSQAEVKPEPRLGAGLAPAWTGLGCASTPFPTPWPVSGRVRSASPSAGAGEVATRRGRGPGGRRARPPKADPPISLPCP